MALLAPQLCNQLSSDTHQAASEAQTSTGAGSALPPLAPKATWPSALTYRRLPSSELRRVPRPRFRLANQRPTATRRSLLDDFDAVEDFSDDGSLQLDADCSSTVSSLIKAHVQPGYQRQHLQPRQQEQLREWCLRKDSSHASYQVGSVYQ